MTIKIGEKIKRLRHKTDVTQDKLAEYLENQSTNRGFAVFVRYHITTEKHECQICQEVYENIFILSCRFV